MKNVTTKAYDFPLQNDKKTTPAGLPGDPEMRRLYAKQQPKGPRPLHIVTCLVIVPSEDDNSK